MDVSPYSLPHHDTGRDHAHPFDGPDVIDGIMQSTRDTIVFARFSDGSTEFYWGGYEGNSHDPLDLIAGVRRRDPQAQVQVYDRNRSNRYQMMGPTDDQFGAGWYVLCDLDAGPVPWGQPNFRPAFPFKPPTDPRLVRAYRIFWHDHHPLEVTGVDCDTGLFVPLCQVYYVLGPRDEDAAPFRTDRVARLDPSRVRPTHQF